MEKNTEYSQSLWFGKLMSQLRGWLYMTAENPCSSNTNIATLVEDWEWVLSTSEILANLHAEKEAKKVKEELEKVRETGKWMKMKSKFSVVAKELFDNLQQDSKDELEHTLTGSMISKIVSDTIDHYQNEWLVFIKETIVTAESATEYARNWPEIKPYQKNVVGAIKEMAFQALYASGKETKLTPATMGETFWAIWKVVSNSVREFSNFSACEAVAGEISKAQSYFLGLWLQTVKNSKLGKANEGKVILKWKEEATEKNRLEKEKRTKYFEEHQAPWKPDAKYEAIIYKDFRSGGETMIDMKKMRTILERKLDFVKIPVRH